jgi:hypothetical protein
MSATDRRKKSSSGRKRGSSKQQTTSHVEPSHTKSRDEKPVIKLPVSITVKHLSELIGVSPIDIIKQLMRNGLMANINQVIDFDMASNLVTSFGYEVTAEKRQSASTSTKRKRARRFLDDDPLLLT